MATLNLGRLIWLVIIVCLKCATSKVAPQKHMGTNYARYGDAESTELIQLINSQQSSWKAGINKNFVGWSTETLKSIMGAKVLDSSTMKPLQRRVQANLPDSFDSRERWPFCKYMSAIRDQANCGSCWAEATTEMITDRICIQSNGAEQRLISSDDLMSCCVECGGGCFGGYPERALNYWNESGIVTGGDFGSDFGCRPYEIAPCPPAGCTSLAPTPACVRKCEKDYCNPYAKDKYFGQDYYKISGYEAQIRQEIFDHGPVAVTFEVYNDFTYYKSGVYIHTQWWTVPLGLHAVKIIGWGEENRTPYWIVANSWNATWGENGFFRIRRGTDECYIESTLVLGGVARL